MGLNKFEEKIFQTKAYLNYIEKHYNNVQKAAKELEEKLKGKEFFFVDPVFTEIFDMRIREHDLSKLSEHEFIHYRQFFYPCSYEEKNKDLFKSAWEHHWQNNSHHWQNWSNIHKSLTTEAIMDILENVVDWMAMGYEFGDNAKEYYENNREFITLPPFGREFLEEILGYIYEDNEGN